MTYREYFNLQEGERIVHDIKPLSCLRTYWFVLSLFPVAVIAFFFSFVLLVPLLYIIPWTFVILALAVVVIVFFLIDLWSVNRRYNMMHYWITNKRVIQRRGFIGYSIYSVPLERISDIMISRSFVERLFGFGSLHIQSLAGQYTYSSSSRYGSESSLLAVPDPEGLQKEIFSLVQKKRKTERLTF